MAEKEMIISERKLKEYERYLKKSGYQPATVEMYMRYLKQFYDALPDSKRVSEKNLKKWQKNLQEQNLPERTVNAHISSVNGFLRFCGFGIERLPVKHVTEADRKDEFTRDDYIRLMRYVREHGTRRDYLLIEALAVLGLKLNRLDLLTVDACENSEIRLKNNETRRIPHALKNELLDYVNEKHIEKGPVFVTSCGNVMDRSNITHMIGKYGKQAGLNTMSCTPSALYRMYQCTQKNFDDDLKIQKDLLYERLLEQEKLLIEE